MKRISRAAAVYVVGIVGLFVIAGCQPVRVPATVALARSIGLLTVQSEVPSTTSGLVTFNNPSGISIGSGTFGLTPAAITVTPTGPGKLVALQATTSTLTITLRVAPAAERETVCETGEVYGPFNVTLDQALTPVAIDPSNVTITQSTVDLLNAGSFSLCIEAVSPIDGTVEIESLLFDLGL